MPGFMSGIDLPFLFCKHVVLIRVLYKQSMLVSGRSTHQLMLVLV